MYFPQL
jgi:nucleotide-binding universal stress UspA family protein